MFKNKNRVLRMFLLVIFLVIPFLMVGITRAQYTSPNYQIEELFFGTGGELEATSPNFGAQQSIGETGIANTEGTDFQANAGFNTSDSPFLEVFVPNSSIDLGTLSSSTTATTTSTFWVRAYLASGYNVITTGNPPTYGNEDIDPISSPSASSTGTEQFGINLKANTDPTTFGADPSQYPDSTFGFGYAASDYDTANQYKYASGDTIAKSDSSSGRTDYTISYIYNINPISPAGEYIFEQDLVVVANY